MLNKVEKHWLKFLDIGHKGMFGYFKDEVEIND